MKNTRVGKDQIAFEVFHRSADDAFGITVTTHDNTFDAGPFNTFDEAQNTVQTLVNNTIKGQVVLGNRVEVKSVLLSVVPCHDIHSSFLQHLLDYCLDWAKPCDPKDFDIWSMEMMGNGSRSEILEIAELFGTDAVGVRAAIRRVEQVRAENDKANMEGKNHARWKDCKLSVLTWLRGMWRRTVGRKK